MAFPLPHFPFFLNKIFSCWIQDVKVCTLLSSMGFQGKQPFSNITDIRKNKLILVLSIIIFHPSVQFSCSVVSHSLWPHGLQQCQASLSITNSWSLLKFISIELVMPSNHLILCRPFSSCLQSFPASGSFQMSQFFVSGGQSTGSSASVLPVNIQDLFQR